MSTDRSQFEGFFRRLTLGVSGARSASAARRR